MPRWKSPCSPSLKRGLAEDVSEESDSTTAPASKKAKNSEGGIEDDSTTSERDEEKEEKEEAVKLKSPTAALPDDVDSKLHVTQDVLAVTTSGHVSIQTASVSSPVVVTEASATVTPVTGSSTSDNGAGDVSSGLETEMRNRSLEALFQVTDTELQNISRQNRKTVVRKDSSLSVSPVVTAGGGGVVDDDQVTKPLTILSTVGPAGDASTPSQQAVSVDPVVVEPISPSPQFPHPTTSPHLQSSASGASVITQAKSEKDDAGYKLLYVNEVEVVTSNDGNGKLDQVSIEKMKRKRSAPGRHICTYCGHGCAKPSVLEKHIRKHTNERPFPCSLCGFSFKTKSNLYKHCKSYSHVSKVRMSLINSDGKCKVCDDANHDPATCSKALSAAALHSRVYSVDSVSGSTSSSIVGTASLDKSLDDDDNMDDDENSGSMDAENMATFKAKYIRLESEPALTRQERGDAVKFQTEIASGMTKDRKPLRTSSSLPDSLSKPISQKGLLHRQVMVNAASIDFDSFAKVPKQEHFTENHPSFEPGHNIAVITSHQLSPPAATAVTRLQPMSSRSEILTLSQSPVPLQTGLVTHSVHTSRPVTLEMAHGHRQEPLLSRPVIVSAHELESHTPMALSDLSMSRPAASSQPLSSYQTVTFETIQSSHAKTEHVTSLPGMSNITTPMQISSYDVPLPRSVITPSMLPTVYQALSFDALSQASQVRPDSGVNTLSIPISQQAAGVSPLLLQTIPVPHLMPFVMSQDHQLILNDKPIGQIIGHPGQALMLTMPGQSGTSQIIPQAALLQGVTNSNLLSTIAVHEGSQSPSLISTVPTSVTSRLQHSLSACSPVQNAVLVNADLHPSVSLTTPSSPHPLSVSIRGAVPHLSESDALTHRRQFSSSPLQAWTMTRNNSFHGETISIRSAAPLSDVMETLQQSVTAATAASPPVSGSTTSHHYPSIKSALSLDASTSGLASSRPVLVSTSRSLSSVTAPLAPASIKMEQPLSIDRAGVSTPPPAPPPSRVASLTPSISIRDASPPLSSTSRLLGKGVVTHEMLSERIQQLISLNAAIMDNAPIADPPRPKRLSRQNSDALSIQAVSRSNSLTGPTLDANTSQRVTIPSISLVPLPPLPSDADVSTTESMRLTKSFDADNTQSTSAVGVKEKHKPLLKYIHDLPTYKVAHAPVERKDSSGLIPPQLLTQRQHSMPNPDTESQEITIEFKLPKCSSAQQQYAKKSSSFDVSMEQRQISTLSEQQSLQHSTSLNSGQNVQETSAKLIRPTTESSVIKDLLLRGRPGGSLVSPLIQRSVSEHVQRSDSEHISVIDETPGEIYKCEFCGITFKKVSTLQLHKLYNCPVRQEELGKSSLKAAATPVQRCQSDAGSDSTVKYLSIRDALEKTPSIGSLKSSFSSSQGQVTSSSSDKTIWKPLQDVVIEHVDPSIPRKKGRPKGSKNKPKDFHTELTRSLSFTGYSTLASAGLSVITSQTQLANGKVVQNLMSPVQHPMLVGQPVGIGSSADSSSSAMTVDLTNHARPRLLSSTSVPATSPYTEFPSSGLTPMSAKENASTLMKMRLKGKILMKRSMSVERMLSTTDKEQRLSLSTGDNALPAGLLNPLPENMDVSLSENTSPLVQNTSELHTPVTGRKHMLSKRAFSLDETALKMKAAFIAPIMPAVRPITLGGLTINTNTSPLEACDRGSGISPSGVRLLQQSKISITQPSMTREIAARPQQLLQQSPRYMSTTTNDTLPAKKRRLNLDLLPSSFYQPLESTVPIVVAQPFIKPVQIASIRLQPLHYMNVGQVHLSAVQLNGIPGLNLQQYTLPAINISGCASMHGHRAGGSALPSTPIGMKVPLFGMLTTANSPVILVKTPTTPLSPTKVFSPIGLADRISPVAKTTRLQSAVSIEADVSSKSLASPLDKPILRQYGHSYPSLRGMTHVTFCCLEKPQPIYVPLGNNKKISMYSDWRVAPQNLNPAGLSSKQILSLYQSRYTSNPVYNLVKPDKYKIGVITHSSYWKHKTGNTQQCSPTKIDGSKMSTLKSEPLLRRALSKEGLGLLNPDGGSAMVTKLINDEQVMCVNCNKDTSATSKEKLKQVLTTKDMRIPKRHRIFHGGFKSDEIYTYVRGRGRGKYVCETCGIRCKKPSMLKKHIRTHTDVRPYRCSHCDYSFKTKGNLTKHMKSKSHQKKCVLLGIEPMLSMDESLMDDDVAQTGTLRQSKSLSSTFDNESSIEIDDDDDDDEDEDDTRDGEDDDDGDEDDDLMNDEYNDVEEHQFSDVEDDAEDDKVKESDKMFKEQSDDDVIIVSSHRPHQSSVIVTPSVVVIPPTPRVTECNNGPAKPWAMNSGHSESRSRLGTVYGFHDVPVVTRPIPDKKADSSLANGKDPDHDEIARSLLDLSQQATPVISATEQKSVNKAAQPHGVCATTAGEPPEKRKLGTIAKAILSVNSTATLLVVSSSASTQDMVSQSDHSNTACTASSGHLSGSGFIESQGLFPSPDTILGSLPASSLSSEKRLTVTSRHKLVSGFVPPVLYVKNQTTSDLSSGEAKTNERTDDSGTPDVIVVTDVETKADSNVIFIVNRETSESSRIDMKTGTLTPLSVSIATNNIPTTTTTTTSVSIKSTVERSQMMSVGASEKLQKQTDGNRKLLTKYKTIDLDNDSPLDENEVKVSVSHGTDVKTVQSCEKMNTNVDDVQVVEPDVVVPMSETSALIQTTGEVFSVSDALHVALNNNLVIAISDSHSLVVNSDSVEQEATSPAAETDMESEINDKLLNSSVKTEKCNDEKEQVYCDDGELEANVNQMEVDCDMTGSYPESEVSGAVVHPDLSVVVVHPVGVVESDCDIGESAVQVEPIGEPVSLNLESDVEMEVDLDTGNVCALHTDVLSDQTLLSNSELTLEMKLDRDEGKSEMTFGISSDSRQISTQSETLDESLRMQTVLSDNNMLSLCKTAATDLLSTKGDNKDVIDASDVLEPAVSSDSDNAVVESNVVSEDLDTHTLMDKLSHSDEVGFEHDTSLGLETELAILACSGASDVSLLPGDMIVAGDANVGVCIGMDTANDVNPCPEDVASVSIMSVEHSEQRQTESGVDNVAESTVQLNTGSVNKGVICESSQNIATELSENSAILSPGEEHVPVLTSSCDESRSKVTVKFICQVCQKSFQHEHQLKLHKNIHYFERPFRCKDCHISFRAKGHLVKHQRSSLHTQKMVMNQSFAAPTSDNPRPFKCVHCDIAFRNHGHLSKHLRSKIHILSLEKLGKVPNGTYNLVEKCDASEIDATTCESTLDSVLMLIRKSTANPLHSSTPDKCELFDSSHEADVPSGETRDGQVSVVDSEHSTHIADSVKRSGDTDPPSDSRCSENTMHRCSPVSLHRGTKLLSDSEQKSKNFASSSETDVDASRSTHCDIMFDLHTVPDYAKCPTASNDNVTVEITTDPIEITADAFQSTLDSTERDSLKDLDEQCRICLRRFASASEMKAHLLTHEVLRPHVCEFCDAGFTNSQSLKTHLQTHAQEQPYICGQCGTTFCQSDMLKKHIVHEHGKKAAASQGTEGDNSSSPSSSSSSSTSSSSSSSST